MSNEHANVEQRVPRPTSSGLSINTGAELAAMVSTNASAAAAEPKKDETKK